ncbi:MAG TPA: hypothetical protein VF179_25150 [Thermoanaerobaculia bacterium]|nr:hypothetical protein [Thermoanaerobaculia bacterium]
MPTLPHSEDFKLWRRLGRLHVNSANDVFVISRFDRNDATIEIFYSTAYSPHPAPNLLPVTLVAPTALQRALRGATLVDDRGKKRALMTEDSDVFIYTPTPGQGGGHAEEMFIRSLPRLFTEYGQPFLIEIYISKIPCGEASPSWIGPRPDDASKTMLWPQGCGPKFHCLFKLCPSVDFELIYEDTYPATSASQALSMAWITKIVDLGNARAGLYANFA